MYVLVAADFAAFRVNQCDWLERTLLLYFDPMILVNVKLNVSDCTITPTSTAEDGAFRLRPQIKSNVI